MKYWVKNWR